MAASCQNVKTNHLNEADENKVKTFFSVVMGGAGGGSGLGVRVNFTPQPGAAAIACFLGCDFVQMSRRSEKSNGNLYLQKCSYHLFVAVNEYRAVKE